jgi:uncharacterized protein YneF (UPF0154 family)
MNRKRIDQVTSSLGLLLAVVLLIAGILTQWGGHFATNQIKSQLKEEQIFFPPAVNAAYKALPAADAAAMEKYAGQQMLTGAQAETYADHFIRIHLQEIGQGKTYSEVSILSMADPKNAALAGEVQTLFRGESLRAMLLNAYAFGFVGNIAIMAGWVCYGGAALFLLLALLGFAHSKKSE